MLTACTTVAPRDDDARGEPGRGETADARPSVDGAVDDDARGPLGGGDGWTLAFGDEFDGDAVDWTRWDYRSSALADFGQGNLDNQQLEWNQAESCAVEGGVLTITARREAVTSPSGQSYGWTSCLLSSQPSFTFRHGFIETRARFPPERGFWPAFWTWQADGVMRWTETDVYEYYSDNRTRLYQTSHGDEHDGCELDLSFDPTADFHVYGADIGPTGTTYYVDGVATCTVSITHEEDAAIVDDLYVYSVIPPDAATQTAVKQVDYIRAWQR